MKMAIGMPSHAGRIWNVLVQLSGIALFILLAIAYATGEEYPHTYEMIGYAIALVVVMNLFWLMITPRSIRSSLADCTPHAVAEQFQNAGGFTRTIVYLIAILAALPLFALLIMLLTHSIWGTTWIDEIHEVVAYFLLGLVAAYIVMVAIAGFGYIEERLHKQS